MQAAKQVADAQRQVVDAERDLRDAQEDAADVQAELNDARREAARSLEDMNQRLAESHLDEREAVLRLKEAEKELRAAQREPGTDPADLERLQLNYERAKLNLVEQRTETKRLAADTAAANKAGVEGSEQVVAAKERIADANETVADRERALADAQRGVAEAQQDGARQIADAQRAVADAAAAVADAQAAAASQTSAVDDAMAKLAPNARSFVGAVQALAPAWDAMRLSVQNALFAGLDDTVTTLGSTTIPVLQSQLTATAGIWNQMAKSAAGAITEMGKSGMLEDILRGANDNLAAFKDTPGQIVTAWGQLSVAAQPALNSLLQGFAGAIESGTSKLGAAFESGSLKTTIDAAFDILGQLAGIAGDAFGAVGNILKAAQDGGGQALAVVGELFAELRRITAMPEVQASLRTIFSSIAQIAAAIAPVIGSLFQAILPLVEALAPTIAQISQALGPALSQLAQALGAALLPIIEALTPILDEVMGAVVQVVQAITPLLKPIGDLIAGIIAALLPVLGPILDVVIDLVDALVGPLNEIIQAFVPYIELLGQVLAEVFGALEPLFGPLVEIVGELAQVFADVYTQLIQTFMDVIVPLLPTITKLVTLIVTLALQVISALMPSLDELIAAGMRLLDAVLPLLPMFAELAVMVLELALKALPIILPPLIDLVGWLVSGLAGAISTVIGWVASIVTWLRKNLGPAFRWLLDEVVIPVWEGIRKGIGAAWSWIKRWILSPIQAFFTVIIPSWGRTLRQKVVGAYLSMRDGIAGVWESIKRNVLNPIRTFFTSTVPGWGTTLKNKMVGAFDAARAGIKTAWDKIKGIAKRPVEFVARTVYNQGIRKVWGYVSKAFGGDPLPEFTGFARGGILPGYTPGRDVHRFFSPTGGGLELSGGEAIMRPEFTRAVGAGFVHTMNAVAKSQGAEGVRAALAPVFGGNPDTPTDRSLRYSAGGVVQRFADGGIFGWIKSKAAAAAGVGSDVWNSVKKAASWLGDTLESSARAGAKNIIDPLLKKFPGMDTGFGRLIRRIPTKLLDALFGYSKESDRRGAGGVGGPKIQRALRWAKAQAGKPYIWGGVGPIGYDCSGFMGAIENVIRGRDPYSRRWATGAFSGRTAPPGWVKNGKSAFRVGITNAGVGHTAGTLGKTRVESRGGDGVVVGSRARGHGDRLFTDWYGFQPGKYDAGGWLRPGATAAFNLTGKPEAVLTSAQWQTMRSAAETAGGLRPGDRLTLVVDGQEFHGYVDARADGRVNAGQRQLVQVLNAG
ncbi:hypothetical protein [Streptomyces albogriseolus]|uniref:hypothetical protein n=1 Tax=Streptomyces albogriseolus TaxID=1887 RepID=UPI00384AA104